MIYHIESNFFTLKYFSSRYTDLPRRSKSISLIQPDVYPSSLQSPAKGIMRTLSSYFKSVTCPVCASSMSLSTKKKPAICNTCVEQNPTQAYTALLTQVFNLSILCKIKLR